MASDISHHVELGLSNNIKLKPLFEAPENILQIAQPFLDKLQPSQRKPAQNNVFFAINELGEADPMIPFFVDPPYDVRPDLQDGWQPHRIAIKKIDLPENLASKKHKTSREWKQIFQVNDLGRRCITVLPSHEAFQALSTQGFSHESAGQPVLFSEARFTLHALAAYMNQYLPGYIDTIVPDEVLNIYLNKNFPVNSIPPNVGELRMQLRDARFWNDERGNDYIIWNEYGKKPAPNSKTIQRN